MLAFKTVTKGHFPEMSDFTTAIQVAEDQTARYARNRFRETVKTWDHKPRFKFRRRDLPGEMVWETYTDDEIYHYVNYGTEPHIIEPKFADMLAFPSMYAAKTKPGYIGSFPGGPGGETVFAKMVEHPGSEPRRFDVAVAAHVQEKYIKRVTLVIRDTARKFS